MPARRRARLYPGLGQWAGAPERVRQSDGDDTALPIIIAALEDKAPVRRRAIVALANFEGPEVEAALERAGEDKDWQVRAAVTQLRDE